MEVQCTKWMHKNEVIKLGKVVFFDDNINHNFYDVPYPKKIVPALDWCLNHAANIGGFVREKKNRIAVFRDIV